MQNFDGDSLINCLWLSRCPAVERSLKWDVKDYSRTWTNTFTINPDLYLSQGCKWEVKLMKEKDHKFILTLMRVEGYGDLLVELVYCLGGQNEVFKQGSLTLQFNSDGEDKDIISSMEMEKAYDILKLTINFKIYQLGNDQVVTNSIEHSFKSEIEFQCDSHKRLSEDIGKLYESKLNCDVVLIIEGETLDVHKSILSARSPVFATMFQQEMLEAKNNVVVIEDVNMATMKEVVAFMYGKARYDYDINTALELYFATHKYQLQKLKEICVAIITSKLNVENAGHILFFSNIYGDEVLKERVMEFIHSRMKSCVKTDWWNSLICSGNQMALDVTTFIANFMKS